MAVCGVPELSWPYSCDIDEANGIRFDPITGRLWAKPETPSYVYEAEAVYQITPGVIDSAPPSSQSALRVWWAGLYGFLGGPGNGTVSTTASITHTNTTCFPQWIQAQAVMPEVRWNMAWHADRCYIGAIAFIDAVQSGLTFSSSHDGVPIDSAGVSPGSVFAEAYPTLGAKAGIVGSPSGNFNYRSAAHLWDGWGGWNQIAPGASITLSYNLLAQCGPARDGSWPGYYQSYADVLAVPNLPILSAQVVTVG